MFWVACFFLLGVCLFLFSLQMALRGRGGRPAVRRYGLGCFAGFSICSAILLYFLYTERLGSFGLTDLLAVGCLYGLAGELFLAPAFQEKRGQKWGLKKRSIRMLLLALCMACLTAARFSLLRMGAAALLPL